MAGKNSFEVGILGGTPASPRSDTLYTGRSCQIAMHEMKQARTAAVLSGGTLVIIVRENGRVISRVQVAAGQQITTDTQEARQ